MPLTTPIRRSGRGRFATGALAVFLAVTAGAVAVPISTAQACDITRKVYNRTDGDLYLEIWRGGTQQWTATEPLKPGKAIALDYVTIGDEILVTGPGPVGSWASNPFGVVLQIFRCDILRISGTSKLGAYDVKVSRNQNAEILVEPKR